MPTCRWHMMDVTRYTFVSAGLGVRAVAEFIGDTEGTVQATYSHMMPDDRDKARRAMERFFARPADGARQTSGGRDVR